MKLRWVGLRAVSHCDESNSTRVVSHCAKSGNWNVRKSKIFQHCSILPCSVSLHEFKQFFFIFEKLISTTSRIYVILFYNTAHSQTTCIVWQFWIFGHFNFLTRHSVIQVELDSSQCDTARSPTQRSFTLRRVTFFVNIFAKTNF